VLLSLICPGLGHLYCGQIVKGVGLLVLTVICAVLSLALVGLVLLSALSAWAIYDAYQTAVKINHEAVVAINREAEAGQ
jgi:TM2 domain-containing membrane protein YozV